MVAIKVKSCPELTNYFLIDKPIVKSVSFSGIIESFKYNSKYHPKSYGRFLQNNPNANRKERINAIKRFLNSVY